VRAFIAFGGNMGDRLANIGAALAAVEALPHTSVLRVSHVYESNPWGAGGQELYANAVAEIDTRTHADDLLHALKDIEASLGRREGPRFGPRPIDLDILLAGDEEWQTPELVVPHPRMAERDFVITPLLEIVPDATWPDGSAVTRDGVRVGHVVGVLGLAPGFEDRAPAERPRLERVSREAAVRPGETWMPVYEYGRDPAIIDAAGGPALGIGAPDIDASFAQVVLEQAGIPHVWDPFPPEKSTDPYGFTRRFRLMVPASMAERAARVLIEANEAPIDWTDAGFDL